MRNCIICRQPTHGCISKVTGFLIKSICQLCKDEEDSQLQKQVDLSAKSIDVMFNAIFRN